MQTATQIDYVRVADYLAAEEASDIRHEYLGGLVYAMAGETRDHNQIVGNLCCLIHPHLKGGSHKLYIIDIRVNFDIRSDEYYYYPDLVVTCDKRDTDKRFIRHPKLLIEVLSPSTERVDKREKFLAYTTMESLEEYVLVAQARREVTIFRRSNDWKAEKVTGAKRSFSLAPLQLKLAMPAVYEGL